MSFLGFFVTYFLLNLCTFMTERTALLLCWPKPWRGARITWLSQALNTSLFVLSLNLICLGEYMWLNGSLWSTASPHSLHPQLNTIRFYWTLNNTQWNKPNLYYTGNAKHTLQPDQFALTQCFWSISQKGRLHHSLTLPSIYNWGNSQADRNCDSMFLVGCTLMFTFMNIL